MYRRLLCILMLSILPTLLIPPRGPALRAAPTRPNIVLIMVDTLRADHLSAYGYPRDTTPNLDTWVAQQGVRFRNASSTTSWTFPANAAIMTGMRPSSIGATWETVASAFPGQARPLAERLHDAGYYTAGFVTAGFVQRNLGFARGYDVYNDSLATRPLSETLAGPLNNLAIDWLQNAWEPTLSGTKPLFLQMYYFDPHSWFNPPPPYDLRYDSTYTGTLTPESFRNGEEVLAGGPAPSSEISSTCWRSTTARSPTPTLRLGSY